MSRANALAFVQALAIILCVLYGIGKLEERDEIARANKQETRAERAAQADRLLGVERKVATR